MKRKILKFIINNKFLYKMIGKQKYFKKMVYEEAQKIIGNR